MPGGDVAVNNNDGDNGDHEKRRGQLEVTMDGLRAHGPATARIAGVVVAEAVL